MHHAVLIKFPRRHLTAAEASEPAGDGEGTGPGCGGDLGQADGGACRAPDEVFDHALFDTIPIAAVVGSLSSG